MCSINYDGENVGIGSTFAFSIESFVIDIFYFLLLRHKPR